MYNVLTGAVLGGGGGGGARSIIPLYSHDVVRYSFFNNLSVFFKCRLIAERSDRPFVAHIVIQCRSCVNIEHCSIDYILSLPVVPREQNILCSLMHIHCSECACIF